MEELLKLRQEYNSKIEVLSEYNKEIYEDLIFTQKEKLIKLKKNLYKVKKLSNDKSINDIEKLLDKKELGLVEYVEELDKYNDILEKILKDIKKNQDKELKKEVEILKNNIDCEEEVKTLEKYINSISFRSLIFNNK